MKQNQKRILSLVALVLVAAVAIGGIALWLRQERLEQRQNEALAELERNAGTYDEQSIVLQETSRAKAEKLAALYGAALRMTTNGRFATLTLPEGTTIRDVYAMEESLYYIEDMAADYQVRASEVIEAADGEKLPQRPEYSVGDMGYEQQTYLDYLNLGRAWYSYTGTGITVAVIDTGIDTDHPEFAGRISEYSYNATEDKIVKDYHDWSLIEDEQGHGTAVTGVLAAPMNGDGIVGVAPNADILVIKAECDANGNFLRTSDLVFGLYYAIERDVHVVNMSFGAYGQANPFAEAVQLAYDSDIICVAAAGNDNTSALTWPAADPHVIGVGALDGWQRAFYSNVGENVDLMAPGTTYTTLRGGSYGNSTGTSLASPIVAGTVALLLQQNPYTTFENVIQVLYASCYDLGDLGRDWYYGFGALDVSALLLEDRGGITYDMLTDELENMEGIYIQGHTLQELPEPERLYAVFDGWYYDDTFTQEYNYYEDRFYGEELTLYAKWVNEEDGIPYTYVVLDDGTVEIRSYTGHRKYITIPEQIEGRIVSSIGDFAFAGQTSLREVTLPSGLRQIGLSAFENCANLVQIRIPENVTQIKAGAFSGNVRLSTVAFAGNSKLSVIGDLAFFGCSSLKQIELPAALRSVNGSAFGGATALYSITVQRGNTAFQSKDGVLFDLSGSALVAFPAAWGSSYTLPAETSHIGQYAFAFARIQTVDLTNVTVIGDNAFFGAELKRLEIPDSVQQVGKRAFMANKNLSSVTIGRGLAEIGMETFQLCTSLQGITIPNNILALGSGVFANTGLQEVIFEENSSLTVIGDGAFLESCLGQIDVPASVQSIGNMAFLQTPLYRVEFAPESALQVIGAEAFGECWALRGIALPETLQMIGDFAFRSSGLTEVTVPAGVTVLGNGAFALCTDLTAVTVAPGNAVYHDVDGVVYTLDNLTIHTYPAAHAGEYYTIDEATEMVAPWAFAGTVHLYGVQLPEGLTQISEYGFSSCQQLGSIIIPNNVLQIGRYAFAYNWQMYGVHFGDDAKLPRLGYAAFAYSGITSIRIPANVSTMAQKVFEGCRNLSSITFAENSKLESISAYLFDGCENLYSIVFENGSALTSIQAHGLEGMDRLQEIDFGDAKLTNVDNFAFRFCKNLSELKLPETVTNIGRYAFYGCRSLSELTVPEQVEHIGSYAFLGTQDLDLYFAGENLPKYLDENWDYGTKGYYTGVSSVEENETFRYAVLPSGNIAILRYLGQQTHVDLTQVNLGGPITIIGGSAFQDTMVQSIVLPESLTEIQAEAFQYTPLERITIPAAVTFIGREAFAHTEITALTFAAGSQLTVVEQYAFESTQQLTSVTLPASLTTVGTGVFQESGLESVTFAAGIQLTEIPQRAFANTKLTAVALPDSVMLVNHNAFNGVQTLKQVTFGSNDGIRLMSNAFYHTGLESLHIPANVTYIGEYCFVALPNLQAFTVDEHNPNYKAVDGLLLTKDGRKLIAVPAGRTGSLTVPEGVEEIGFGAFEESKLSEISFLPDANILSFGYRAFFKAENITTITIPKSVVAIDYYAFAYCENLQEVIFAEDNLLKGIYEGAFCGDNRLSQITIPDSIVEISDFAFYGCSKLESLPISNTQNLKGIYDYAFAYSGLRGAFTTPENLWDIGDYAFLGCRFTEVTIPDTNKKDLIIGIGAFENCNQLESITLPFLGASYEDEQISWLGYIFGAGSYEANRTYVPRRLKTVTITDGISFIGLGGFSYCTGLETIQLPDSVSDIYAGAFMDTVARYELTNTIHMYTGAGGWREQYPFLGNEDVGSGISGQLTLGEGLQYISLNQCPNLTGITIPEGVEHVDLVQTGISELDFPDSVTYIYCVYNDSLWSVRLPATMKTVPNGAFAGCVNLQYVQLPEGLEVIEDSAFAECAALTKIEIPNSVQRIGPYAFQSCTALTGIRLPEKLQTIEDYAFSGCISMYEIINHSNLTLSFGSEDHGRVAMYARWIIDREGNKTCLVENGDASYVDTEDGFRFLLEKGEYTLISYFDSEETLYLPLTVQGQPYQIRQFRSGKHIVLPEGMTEISENAFEGNTQLESIEIPDSVTQIGQFAFSECRKLQSVQLPKKLTVIAPNLFFGCSSLESVEIPGSVVEIGQYAFAECGALGQVALPESLQTIGVDAFRMAALTDLRIPASLQFIEPGAFNSCPLETITVAEGSQDFVTVDSILYNREKMTIYAVPAHITHAVIPATVVEIGSAFSHCTALRSVEFEAGSQLVAIPHRAFAGCTSLEQIVWPEHLQYIASMAFEECNALKTLRLPDTLTSLETDAFWNCTGLTELYLPAGITNEWIANTVTGCSSLQKVHVDANNAVYCSVDGIVYTKDMTRIVLVPAGRTGTVVIPEGVANISGFQYSKVTEVILPESATTIVSFAFNECHSLERIYIPDGVTNIEYGAFWNCIALEEVRLPNGLASIEDQVFYGCESLRQVEIPDSVTTLGYGAFWNCFQLKTVKFSANLKRIGDSAFDGCGNLRYADIPEGVESIGAIAFSNCTEMLWVTLPESLLTVGEDAFNSCWKLQEVRNHSDLPLVCGSESYGQVAKNAKSIVDRDGNRTLLDPNSMFAIIETQDGFVFQQDGDQYTLIAYLGKAETVTLPLTFNGKTYAMSQVDGIRHLIVPEGFVEISGSAFWGSLTLEQVTLPESLTTIGSGAFAYCRNLRKISIPESVTYLDSWAFMGCTALEKIHLGENLIDLGSEAFQETAFAMDPANWSGGCLYLDRYLLDVDESLISLTVREDTLLICDSAFDQCHVLKTIQTGVYGTEMLSDCVNLETLILTRNLGQLSDIVPITLKNIVLTETFHWNKESDWFFGFVQNVTIFVEAKEAELRWDDNFPNWNLDLPVVYGENWIWANFYDRNGELIQSTPQKTSAIVRLPYVADEPGYAFAGWDLDGDGIADSVPATSVVDIHAYALMQQVCDHHYEAVVTAPTCTEPGSIVYVCTICGETVGAPEETPTLGHDYQQGVCTRCGQKDPDYTGTHLLLGDLNMDGKVNSADVSLLFRYVSRDASLKAFTAEQLAVADVNQDGRVNSSDVSVLYRYAFKDTTLTWAPKEIIV